MYICLGSYCRPFSKAGLGLDGGVGRRDSSEQSNFIADMMEKYRPNPPARDYRWDPVLERWMNGIIICAAHLFPYRQSLSMEEIFGEGSKAGVFTAENIHRDIEDALNKGLLAIIPDLDLGPADPRFLLDDQQERQDRVKQWENQEIKEYKLSSSRRTTNEPIPSSFFWRMWVSKLYENSQYRLSPSSTLCLVDLS